MRTSTLVVLSLSTAATLVTADSKEGAERGAGTGGGGALQALLERMQKTKHDNHARGLKDAQVRPAPSDYSDGTGTFDERRNATSTEDADPTVRSKFVKSTDRPVRHNARVPSSSDVAASKHRLRSTESARRPASTKSQDLPTLERQLRVAESNKPLSDEEFDSITAAEAETTSIKSNKKVQEKAFGKKHEDKRWVWGTAIIQDDTPAASNVPAVGQNANYLNSNPVNTPAANLVAPSFPPLAAPSFPPVAAAAVVSSQTTPPAAATTTPASRQKIGNRKQAKPAAPKEKRWTWGTSIIQDGSPDAPPVGENANLLSSGTTIALNTPVASLSPPSFPPLAEPTPSSSSVETPAPVETEEAQAGVASASSVLSSVAAEATAPGTTGIQALLVKLQAEIDMLAQVYGQASATADAVETAAATSPAENAKRWVWGPSIIQDDSPSSAVPPIGENTNLFNPAVPVATPTNQPVAPSFPPIAPVPAPAPAPAPVVPAPAPANGGKALASDYAGRIGLASVAQAQPVTPPAPNAPVTTSAAHRNRKSEADSIRSVRDAASKTAALEWHLVNQKRKVGGMNKLHKRQ
ncbi:hypothetical protein JCM11491_005698 [Sporobolomyces phaffii]